jgi:hypothetical protein
MVNSLITKNINKIFFYKILGNNIIKVSFKNNKKKELISVG